MRALGTLLILMVIGACSAPQKVIQFVNKEADFKNYYSYRIINYKTEKKGTYSANGTAFFNELESEISKEMSDRSYTKEKNADLVVRYETATGIKTSTNAPNYNGNAYNYDPYGVNQNRQRKSLEGLLLLEIKDKSKKLVWQGSMDIKFSKDLEENRTLLKNAVHRIFETFLYRAGNDQPVELSN